MGGLREGARGAPTSRNTESARGPQSPYDPAMSGETRDLFGALYEELRRMAARIFRSQRPGHTLEATALVHEAYLKLARAEAPPAWRDRAHVLAVAARAMRQEPAKRRTSTPRSDATK